MDLASKLALASPPVFLMDGTAFIYRSFYANRHLRRSDGFPTNALTLVTRVLLRILKRESPRYFLFAMDGRGHNLRKDIYAAYKANREAMPEDLALQIEPIRRTVRALGLRDETVTGHEADDCINSLAARLKNRHPVIIVSGDKDLKQCLGPNVFMWDPASKEEKLLTAGEFEASEGVSPDHWADMQALIGDSSDNIPGVPGIGPKTARQIFQKCKSLEEIRDHLDRLPEKLRAKLAPHLDEMFVWRKLTKLSCDACAGLALDDLRVRPVDLEECGKIAREFELAAIYREIALLSAPKGAAGARPEKQQPLPGNAAVQEPGLPAAPEIRDAGALPPCGCAAIVWPHGPGKPPRLAASEKIGAPFTEYLWTGTMGDLCGWLEKAGRIIVPDFKTLLAASPSWRRLLSQKGKLPVTDLALASWLLDPEDEGFSWPRLANRWGPQLGGPETGPATLAALLGERLMARLSENGLLPVYENIELPLSPVLAEMQERGFAIDPSAFAAFLKDVQGRIDELEKEIFRIAGGSFNIRSSQKLGEVLFEKLKLPQPAKTRTGQFSTSQATLEKLSASFPIVESLLEFRKLEKMRSTYLDPLPRFMDADNRIHSTFNQEATATGRISSSDPNLQNIPVRGPLGERMRGCFVSKNGNLLVAADYSQIELRILAHMSGDENLLAAFRQGEDIHARTASLIFDIPAAQLASDQRRMAKTINFGLLYGMGSRKLAQELKITPAMAKEFIDKYFEKLTGLKEFYARVLTGAREKGYVETLSGRKRWLPGIHSANGQTVAQAERQAVNTVIQGTAADIMKLAMINVARDPELNRLDAKLVLQVHDELLLETPESNAAAVGERTASLMRGSIPGGLELRAPLLVDWGIGKNWGEAH